MKTLIVEDEFTSRLLLQMLLKDYGECHLAVNGKEALVAFEEAMKCGRPYDLVCLDIMMPEMDGQETLKQMRALEDAKGITSTSGAKIIMTTALGDAKNLFASYRNLCDGYCVKPINNVYLLDQLRELKLIQ